MKRIELLADCSNFRRMLPSDLGFTLVYQQHVNLRREDLAALSPYQTRHIKRFGDYVFTVTAPEPFDADLITPFALEAISEEQSAIA